MDQLQVINRNGQLLVDSREVAEMLEKRHDHLLRDIAGYVEILEKNTAPNFGVSDFFVESSYQDSTGRTLKCYLLTRKGCDMIANKMTGEKGVLFTATYVTRFEEMERKLIQPKTQAEMMLMYAQQFVEQERRVIAIEEKQAKQDKKVDAMASVLTATPDRQRFKHKIREYAKLKGFGVNEAQTEVFRILEDKQGIDLTARVRNRRNKINEERVSSGKKPYKPDTLKSKYNRMDAIEELKLLPELMQIVAGLIGKIVEGE